MNLLADKFSNLEILIPRIPQMRTNYLKNIEVPKSQYFILIFCKKQ